MKTLDQVQPRTPIDPAHTPGDSTNQFIITASGSYYLTGNVNGTSGKNGIAITSGDVTIDLNGFGLLGASGSLSGAVVSGARQNVVIYNGTTRGWGSNGIDAAGASGAQLTRLQVSGNGGAGLIAGSNSLVRDCVAAGNSGDGIRVTGTATRIEDNNCPSNGAAGVRVDTPGNLVIKNNATANGGSDYDIASGTSYGQIVQTPGANFTSATAWANFSSSCPAGQSFCGGVCASLATNPNNCGTCGNVCTVANGTPACTNGNCQIASCNTGFANCDNQYGNGCEVNTTNNASNCGACGTVCTNGANVAVSSCSNSTCMIATCNTGFGNCDGQYPNGCETNLGNNVNNCGSCGNVCTNGANVSTTSCIGSTCTIGSCSTGFANCDGQYANGCEVNTNTNLFNCGSCGHVCSNAPNATVGCSFGGCVIASCSAGFANCDGQYANGCEINTNTDHNNCGTCGHVCAVFQTCSGGICN